MDKSLLNRDREDEHEEVDGVEHDQNTNQYKAAYYSTMLDNSSSDEEEVEDEKVSAGDDKEMMLQTPSDEVKSEDEDREKEVEDREEDGIYNILEDEGDDDFEEFQSSESFQLMTSVAGELPSHETKVATKALHDTPLSPSFTNPSTAEEERETVPPQLPSDRIAPLTADHIAKIKAVMRPLKISARSGPILDVVQKLEGARLGDEKNDVA